MNLRRIAQLALLFSLGFSVLTLMNGCSKSDSCDNIDIDSTFTSIYGNLLSTTCSSCHIPGGVATEDGANFDLSSQATAYSTLTSNPFGGTSSSGCETVSLVDASSSSTSGLAAVLFEDIHQNDFVVSGCTPYSVHHSDQNLCPDERSAIINWINDGAQDN